MAIPPHPVLRAEGIHKHYGAMAALRGIDFEVRGGRVHVLIGENGAGKSTLMRVLAGVERPDEGRVLVEGVPTVFASVRDASRQGIGIVFQELNLCANLSVADNIFLNRSLTRGGTIDRTAERAAAARLLDRLGAAIDPDQPVSELRIGQQQIVEIARALADEVRFLILDEPTSALSLAEVETLFGVIDELKRAGVGIVYISHRLEELLRVGDDFTILRDGAVVASAPAAAVSIQWIIDAMLGPRAIAARPAAVPADGAVVLSADNARVARPGGTMLVDGVSVAFRAGEVVAIYGLLGAGRTELLEYLCGARTGTGAVRLNSEAVERLSVTERVRRRLLLVPEDRQRDGLFPNLNVGGNLSMMALFQLVRRGVLSIAAEARAGTAMIGRLGIKAGSGATPITALSGGNQQKVVIGRCLMMRPLALLLDEPSRGIDIGARADVFATMRELAADGVAVVFATSDLHEALTLADRILVMAGGRITADLRSADADDTMLVHAANLAPAGATRALAA